MAKYTVEADIMSREEQLDWLNAMDPVELKAQVIKAVKDGPYTEDIWTFIMQVIDPS